MITQDQWKQAQEEFGENAYKRITRTRDELESNEIVEYLLEKGYANTLSLHTKERLFAQDVEFYGENACLMWRAISETTRVEIPLVDNGSVYECFSGQIKSQLSRKNSAALPFDLKRATNGDIVEVYQSFDNQWITPILVDVNVADDLDVVVYFEHEDFESILIYDIDNEVRMKYPPKVKK